MSKQRENSRYCLSNRHPGSEQGLDWSWAYKEIPPETLRKFIDRIEKGDTVVMGEEMFDWLKVERKAYYEASDSWDIILLPSSKLTPKTYAELHKELERLGWTIG